jgi:5-methylcytosine-specific restriction enzyme A
MPSRPPRHGARPQGPRHVPRDTPAEAEAHRFYNRVRWRSVRQLVLAGAPLCVACEAKGRTTPATDVDHIKPRRERPDLEYTLSNLQPLCHRCHSVKTAKE